jgi:hypothetical protein
MDSNKCLNYMGIFLKLSITICIDEFWCAGIAVERVLSIAPFNIQHFLFFLEKIYTSFVYNSNIELKLVCRFSLFQLLTCI